MKFIQIYYYVWKRVKIFYKIIKYTELLGIEFRNLKSGGM